MTFHKAIPTVYRGIQMRSRLEAKWACVFDQLGWTWEYEPFDLAGWIPDFLVTKAPGIEGAYAFVRPFKPFLVEVKPLSVRRLHEHAGGPYAPADVVDKIEPACGAPPTRRRNGRASGDDLWVPYFESRPYDVLLAGVNPKTAWLWQQTASWWFCGGHPAEPPYFMGDDWAALWARAHNETQWNRPQ